MGANPAVFTCTAGAWTKVATGVQSGVVHKLSNRPARYLQTYRLTGEAAPTDDSDAAQLFADEVNEQISNDVLIDVYVKAVTKDGKIRVDL